MQTDKGKSYHTHGILICNVSEKGKKLFLYICTKQLLDIDKKTMCRLIESKQTTNTYIGKTGERSKSERKENPSIKPKKLKFSDEYLPTWSQRFVCYYG